MDLTGWLLRVAANRPHVLMIPVPGETRARLRTEAEVGRRGWPLAGSPADADLLVVAGQPGPQLVAVIDTVWAQMPAPRARVDITAIGDVAEALDGGVRDLVDLEAHRGTAGPETPSDTEHWGDDGAAESDELDESEPAGRDGDEGSGHHESSGDHDPAGDQDTAGGDHVHHVHGEGMEVPGGIPMADLGEDRDGLMLDALHVAVGPVLPDWPAGLVLRLVLQGDVITEAQAEVLDPPELSASFWTEPAQRHAAGEKVTVGDLARRAAAGHLDGLSRFLGVAGWVNPASRARRLRDALLIGAPAGPVADAAADLVKSVGRSRTLGWLIRGIPAGDDDVAGRLRARLAALGAALDALEDARFADDADPSMVSSFAVDRSTVAPGELASLLVGAEFSAARLVVAALDPDTDRVVATEEGADREHA